MLVPNDLMDRGGVFVIQQSTLNDHSLKVFEVMQNFLVLDARMNAMTVEIEYMAVSPLFRPLSKGEKLPFYTIKYDDNLPNGQKVSVIEEGAIPAKIRKIRIPCLEGSEEGGMKIVDNIYDDDDGIPF